MKLCKNCKYYRRAWFSSSFDPPHLCAHPSAGIDPVTGHTDVSCYYERRKPSDEGHCGKEAKNWEAKRMYQFLNWPTGGRGGPQ